MGEDRSSDLGRLIMLTDDDSTSSRYDWLGDDPVLARGSFHGLAQDDTGSGDFLQLSVTELQRRKFKRAGFSPDS